MSDFVSAAVSGRDWCTISVYCGPAGVPDRRRAQLDVGSLDGNGNATVSMPAVEFDRVASEWLAYRGCTVPRRTIALNGRGTGREASDAAGLSAAQQGSSADHCVT